MEGIMDDGNPPEALIDENSTLNHSNNETKQLLVEEDASNKTHEENLENGIETVTESASIDSAFISEKNSPNEERKQIEEKDLVEDSLVVSDNDESEGTMSGEESDIEDNDEYLYPSQRIRRSSNPDLPENVTVLTTEEGSKVYLLGTAHFSEASQEEVAKVIQETQPDCVVVELCRSRVNILQYDEEKLLEEAKDINFAKIRQAIKQGGLIHGLIHLLILNMSAHLTKQLGMAPGGEFRRAFREALKIPGCRVNLGDRQIQITFKRAFSSLSLWQKLRLATYLILSKDPISKEEVEKCKQKDLLEQMLREMAGEFPTLSQTFITERDIYLAHSLRQAAAPIPHELGYISAVVVGVVGIGHCQGIVEHWNDDFNLEEITSVPPPSIIGSLFRWSIRASLVGFVAWGAYRLGLGTYRFFV